MNSFFFRKKQKKGDATTTTTSSLATGAERGYTETPLTVGSRRSSRQLTPPGVATPVPSFSAIQSAPMKTSSPSLLPAFSPPPRGFQNSMTQSQQAASMHQPGMPPSQSMNTSPSQELVHSFAMSGRESVSSYSLQHHGQKVLLPPGAKLMSGPPPSGVKIMMKGSPLPPGAKLIKGPPPPGMMKKQMMPGVPHGKMQAPPPANSTTPGTKSLSVTAPPAHSPPKMSVPFAPPLNPNQAAKLSQVLPPTPSSSPRRDSHSSSQEKKPLSAPKVSDPKPKPPAFSSCKTKASDIDEVQLRPDAPRNASDSESEIQFVVEEGSYHVGTPVLQESPERITVAPSKGSSMRFNEEPKALVYPVVIQDDDSARARGSTLRQCSQASLHSSPSPSHVMPLEETKEFENGVGGHEKNKSVTSASHHATSVSSLVAEKNVTTPEKQRTRRGVTEYERSSEVSPAALELTLTQKTEKDARALILSPISEEAKDMPVSEGRLSPSVRKRIVEQFFSVLSPQQFYGKVTKLHRIRLMKKDPERAPGLRAYKNIFVVTKGVLPNQYFYPQLRLLESDGSRARCDESPEYLDTPIVLYEAAPGNMLFAETELEAKHIFDINSSATSCFVLDKSAIIFKDPLKFVLPIAMLTVRWIPYSVAQSEPQCPVHHKELQLFDLFSKELLCALCVSKKASHVEDLIVIPEVLGGDSRRQILERLSQQVQERQQSAADWVNQHQRIVSFAKQKKDAVNQQFDLLLAAINAKRNEFLEHCDAAFGYSLSNVAREILTEDERVRLLKAAVDHLRTEITKPLYSMQIATVANALHSSDEFPKPISMESLKLSAVAKELTPNLEGAMAEVHSLSPMAPRNTLRRPHSPFGVTGMGWREFEPEQQQQQQQQDWEDQTQVVKRNTHLESRPSSGIPRPRPSLYRNYGLKENTNGCHRIPKESPRRRSIPILHRNEGMDFGSEESRGAVRRRHQIQWVAIPGCRGTCVLDVPIHELIAHGDGKKNIWTKPKCLQWALRVEDPGEWVGIGVGVGGGLKSWSANRTPDLSHLWVVTCGDTRYIFILRVTVQSSVKHAKLSIHDGKGKRIDDGRIPQWNATRSCYPQVTFGGRIGEVYLMDGPRFVSN
ncbi:hypothetical protein, conserved [Trypanosoma cruzi]|uniref:Uncharacterized protein n=2 Tax=Trypanosoma cruzi TaxID=5693 RepID=Q4CZV0_TRYCC|nr:hypothetical protein, conserved [Trypanosoma cruzi]EAN85803.1 hypothetical protein, conserved [Trypanosoma cruzi]|eukprot:XP_807654.1 hypothetical protein [Trypanosoma cruzi strain CL Brener]